MKKLFYVLFVVVALVAEYAVMANGFNSKMDSLVDKYERNINEYQEHVNELNSKIDEFNDNNMKLENEYNSLGSELTKMYSNESNYKLEWQYDGHTYQIQNKKNGLFGNETKTMY